MKVKEISREKFKKYDKKYEMKKRDLEIVMQEIEFIDESTYQQYKKKMCKSDDYFNVKEWDEILKHRRK